MATKLATKQEVFVQEYLVDLNATQAAIRAGYSPASAGQLAHELLEKPLIAASIQQAMAERSMRTQVTADQVVRELARIGFADLRRVVDWGPDGVTLKHSEDLSAEDAAFISEVGERHGRYGTSVHIKTHDKKGALELLARHLGMVEAPKAGDTNLTQINVTVKYDYHDPLQRG